MTSFLTHSQQIELKRRCARVLDQGTVGTYSGPHNLSPKESRMFEVVMDCLNEMKREGRL